MYIVNPVRIFSLTCLLLATLILSSAVQAQSRDSRLGAGDVVRITVYGQEDLNTTARITKQGNITFPLIGVVRIEGMTNREAESQIELKLLQGKFVRNPQVSIFVEERVRKAGDVVTVIGQVNQPGRFSVDSSSNEGAQTIVGLLALAGGVTENAGDYLVLSKEGRAGGENIRVDLVALMRKGDLSQNYEVTGGDIVLVPAMDVIYVYGEVEKPGRYRLDRDMTVMQAISVGGGLTSVGTEKGVTIKRRGGSGETASLKSSLTDQLEPNDVVVVRESLF